MGRIIFDHALAVHRAFPLRIGLGVGNVVGGEIVMVEQQFDRPARLRVTAAREPLPPEFRLGQIAPDSGARRVEDAFETDRVGGGFFDGDHVNSP